MRAAADTIEIASANTIPTLIKSANVAGPMFMTASLAAPARSAAWSGTVRAFRCLCSKSTSESSNWQNNSRNEDQ
jgi:hypothetical protein